MWLHRSHRVLAVLAKGWAQAQAGPATGYHPRVGAVLGRCPWLQSGPSVGQVGYCAIPGPTTLCWRCGSLVESMCSEQVENVIQSKGVPAFSDCVQQTSDIGWSPRHSPSAHFTWLLCYVRSAPLPLENFLTTYPSDPSYDPTLAMWYSFSCTNQLSLLPACRLTSGKTLCSAWVGLLISEDLNSRWKIATQTFSLLFWRQNSVYHCSF